MQIGVVDVGSKAEEWGQDDVAKLVVAEEWGIKWGFWITI